MTTISDMDWSKLEPYGGKTHRSFEELCYQIAKRLYENKGTFISIDDSGGGDGVEFYLTLPDGNEWGWQAKFYYPNPRLSVSSRKKKIQNSLETTLREHPNLTKWFLCTNTKFTKMKGGEQEWFDEKLKPLAPKVELIHWGESDFLDFLCRPGMEGIFNRFFGEPSQEVDWEELIFQTNEKLDAIQDKIGGKVHIHRTAEIEALDRCLSETKAVFLIGPSGCGKTVLSKMWAQQKLDNEEKVLWWNAASFDVSEFPEFENKLKLGNPLRDLFNDLPDSFACIVIDGLDRVFSTEAFSNLSVLFRLLRLDNNSSPWRVLIPCQPEEWERIQIGLLKANVTTENWKAILINEPTRKELEPVWRAFPSLQSLRLQHELQLLLLKPRVLDLLASKIVAGGVVDTSRWVGESDLIEWFWEQEVCEGSEGESRSRFLQKLAKKQADDLESETPIEFFSSPELTALPSLKQDRLCRKSEEKLSFEDDRYGDWARQRILIGQPNSLKEYLKDRITSPLWHRALRLYGLYLLEQKGVSQWETQFANLIPETPRIPQLEQHILLESVIFAANPIWILENLWSELSANGGILLHHLLERFRHVATFPNPNMLDLFMELDLGSETEASTVERLPYWWPYWVPMIQFLHRHKEDVIELVPQDIALVTEKWLRWAPENYPARREAAELAVELAEKTREFIRGGGYISGDCDEHIFKAALAAASILPERVEGFALEACARNEVASEEPEHEREGIQGDEEQQVTIPVLGTSKGKLPPPWPDGPRRRVDRAFQKICLDGDALHPLILSNPRVAREVMLALLIDHPVRRRRFDAYDTMLDDNLGLQSMIKWFPPFYTHGPFLFFLKNRPEEGLEGILRLVNFATERWVERYKDRDRTPPKFTIHFPDGNRDFSGDNRVYFWYRDSASAPRSVVAALMALEKWLYDKIDNDESIDEIVETTLKSTDSLAFIGLLNAVGKKRASLFLDKLQPFLAIPEFHYWELRYILEGDSHQMLGWEYKLDSLPILTEKAREWHSMPHRKLELNYVAQTLFLNYPQIRGFFEDAKVNWKARLEEIGPDDPLSGYLEKLIVQFDLSHWKTTEHPEHGMIWEFNPPEEFKREGETASKKAEETLQLLGFPLKCLEVFRNNEPLTKDDLEDFWTQLQHISEMKPLPGEPVDIEDCICGGAAVLLHFHHDWLKQYPDREVWCVQQLINTVKNPPPPFPFDSYNSISADWNWDGFCARVIPKLWAANPDSPDLRECMGLLASHLHYRTIALLFYYASQYRDQLGSEFNRLQHLLLRVAALKNQFERNIHPVSLKSEKEKAKLREVIEKRIFNEINAFVTGTLTIELPKWKELIAETKRGQSGGFDGARELPDTYWLDFNLIQAAYSWLPLLSEAEDETERLEWIEFWSQAYDVTMNRLKTKVEREERNVDLPTTWDRWVLERVASLIPYLTSSEHPERFWKPLLEFGAASHYWIEDFLQEWFAHALEADDVTEMFVREWKSMLEFVFSSPQWDFETADSWLYLEDIWCHVMGFGFYLFGREIWQDKHKSLVQRMKDYYKRWAGKLLKQPRCAVSFVLFLKQPAAKAILLDALVWLDEAVSKAKESYFTERDLQSRLASLLDKCWSSWGEQLRQKKEAFDAFKALLKRLADYQNPLALEIQRKMEQG